MAMICSHEKEIFIANPGTKELLIHVLVTKTKPIISPKFRKNQTLFLLLLKRSLELLITYVSAFNASYDRAATLKIRIKVKPPDAL